MQKKSQITFFILLGAFLSLASTPVKAETTFIYCSEGSPSSFNPSLATDGATFNATNATYSKLVDFIPGTTNIAPDLAEKWTISKDKLTYIFTLRKDVPFHSNDSFTPKRMLNADDVLFSFNRQRIATHPYHAVGGGRYEYFAAMGMKEIIQDINKIDDHTVEFVLSKPDAAFLTNLAMEFASIFSKEYADELTKKNKQAEIDRAPIGTGAFVFKKYVKDSMIRYEAFDKYFKGKPAINKLVFVITPDANVRAQKLMTGECHLISEPSPIDLQQFKRNPDIKIDMTESMNVGYLAFNTTKKPFDDVLVRKAIYHAMNRQAYIDAVYLGMATLAKNPMPPKIMGYHEKNYDYPYSPAKAKELLKQAGYEKGFTTELWALPVSRPYNPDGKKMAEMMQADLAKVGIQARIVTYDWPTYLAKTKNGEYTMAQAGWNSDNGDPDNFMYTLLSCDGVETGANRARWCNKEFNDLVWEAKTTVEPSKRAELYIKAQEIFKDEAPWVPIAHSKMYRAMRKNVVGYKIHPLNRDIFTDVELR